MASRCGDSGLSNPLHARATLSRRHQGAYCASTFKSQAFAQLPADDQDGVLAGLERDEVKLAGADGKTFFELLLQNTVEGFFSDPLYGGNRDMVGWKLIGFPGARYDYRGYVSKHGQRIDLAPVGLKGRPDWSPHGG